MIVDPTHPADPAADPAAVVEPAPAEGVAPVRSRRTLWRAGIAVLALGAYGLSAQLSTNDIVVKPGDTLTKIAGDYRTSVKELVAYNHIADPNRIIVGQTIVVPPAAGELRHEVRAGESLTSIAATYGSSIDAILQRNNLPDANMIRIGQTLVVPRAAAAPAPPTPTTTAAPAPTTTAAPAPAAPATTVAALAGGASGTQISSTTATAPPTTAAPTTTAAAPTTAAPTTAAPTTSRGPQPTIPRVTVPSGATVSTMWVVQEGDTIASIAARFGLAPRRLASVNALSENDELVPGQRIYVPQS